VVFVEPNTRVLFADVEYTIESISLNGIKNLHGMDLDYLSMAKLLKAMAKTSMKGNLKNLHIDYDAYPIPQLKTVVEQLFDNATLRTTNLDLIS